MATRSLNVQITGDARNLNRVMDQTEHRSRRFSGALTKGFAVAGAAAAGGLAIGIKKAADAAIEAEKSQAKLTAQLNASGISWSKHRVEIDKAIQAHSKLSGFDDEDLTDSFTNIVRVTGDVDKSLRLTGLAADFARAKHIDVAKAGELVGKVAGGNTGILSRYGITLKEGATSAEALAVLQEKFSGQAEAYGKTTAGALDRASVASENLGEVVGAKLTPLLAKGATALVDLVDKAGELSGPIRSVSGTVRNAYESMARAVRRFMERNREDIDAVIKAASNVAKAFRYWFQEVTLPVIRVAVRAIGRVLENVVQIFRGIIRIVSGVLTGNWSKAWDGVKDVVAGTFKGVFNLLRGAGEILFEIVKRLGGQIIKGIVGGLKGLGEAVFRGIKSGITAAVDKAADWIDKANPLSSITGNLGDGIGRSLGKKAGDGLGFMGGSAGTSGAGLRGADFDLAPFARVGASSGLHVSSGMRAGSITSTGNQSFHATGDAIDMAGPMGGMRRTATVIRNLFGSKIRELISPFPELGIKDGRPFRYSGAIQAQHSGSNAHVHVAYTGPFGDGIGQAASAARAAGFRGNDLLTAIAIAGPESGYRNSARLVTSAEDSRGMWQINTLAHPWARGLNLSDPNTAARAAYRVWREAGGFGPWTAFSSGTYRGYLDEARAVVGGGGRGPRLVDSGAQRGMSPAQEAFRESQQNARVRRGAATRTARRRPGGPGKGVVREAGTLEDLNLPSATDFLDRDAAMAALTPGSEDDLAVERRRRDYWAEQLRIAQGTADPRDDTLAAQNLKASTDAIEALTGEMEAARRDAEQDRAINLEIVENQRLLLKLGGQGDQIVNAVIAAVNGGIGGRVGLGLQSPGYAGGVARL